MIDGITHDRRTGEALFRALDALELAEVSLASSGNYPNTLEVVTRTLDVLCGRRTPERNLSRLDIRDKRG